MAKSNVTSIPVCAGKKQPQTTGSKIALPSSGHYGKLVATTTTRRASVFENEKYSADKCSHEPPLLKIDGIGRKSPSGRLLFLYWPRKKLIIGPLVVCPIVSHSVTQLPNAVELPRGSRLGHGTRVVVKWTGNECHGIFWLTNSFSDNFHCYLLSRPPRLAVPCFLSCACYTQICQ